ncbi:hypothetical protein F7734_24950 [Scytonema sp. UIC 10036]|uniref:hypothetical protein n=1 Tax=Scytonema sp. UIC 10036 TaxID=2304196 RepID=UPI0012DA3BFE|nr:hypothetical protein [Scytonema sp. UIC 10036]MUG95433.1 hypothetical protein [Scytonema sp. UIC 10036]
MDLGFGIWIWDLEFGIEIPDFLKDAISRSQSEVQNAAQQAPQSLWTELGGGASPKAFPGGAWERDGGLSIEMGVFKF